MFRTTVRTVLLWLVIYEVAAGIIGSINPVHVDKAIVRLAQQAEVSPEEIQVLNKSNNNPWLLGDSHDVKFELMINGKPIQGRCESGLNSPMLCRLYGAGDE